MKICGWNKFEDIGSAEPSKLLWLVHLDPGRLPSGKTASEFIRYRLMSHFPRNQVFCVLGEIVRDDFSIYFEKLFQWIFMVRKYHIEKRSYLRPKLFYPVHTLPFSFNPVPDSAVKRSIIPEFRNAPFIPVVTWNDLKWEWQIWYTNRSRCSLPSKNDTFCSLDIYKAVKPNECSTSQWLIHLFFETWALVTVKASDSTLINQN